MCGGVIRGRALLLSPDDLLACHTRVHWSDVPLVGMSEYLLCNGVISLHTLKQLRARDC